MTFKGFTLVEVLVSISVFTVIVAIVTGLFVYALRVQRAILAQQELLDQTSYVMEYLSRGLRMAVRDSNGTCITKDNNYCISDGRGTCQTGVSMGSAVKFLSPLPGTTENECREIFLDSNSKQLKESISSSPDPDRQGIQNAITSSNMEVLDFKVKLDGESAYDNRQPRVTFMIEVKRKGGRAEDQPSIRLQTTVSQRNLDI